MEGYVYRNMWAGPPKYDGVYDVDDSVTALVRTEGTGLYRTRRLGAEH